MALRQFPELHTNPVNVIVAREPIRASRKSARWCVAAIERLWRARAHRIAKREREEAQRTYDRAIEAYRRIAAESPE